MPPSARRVLLESTKILREKVNATVALQDVTRMQQLKTYASSVAIQVTRRIQEVRRAQQHAQSASQVSLPQKMSGIARSAHLASLLRVMVM